MTRIVIQNVRVFDSEVLLEPNDVVITCSPGSISDPVDDGSAAEKSDVVVDGHGCTLIPGLIDANVNIKGSHTALGEFAARGVTTVIDLSSNNQQCQALRVYTAGRTKLPTVLSSGTEAVPARTNEQARLFDDNPDEVVIRSKGGALAFAAARASGPDRADFVKASVELSAFDDDLLKTIAEAAHDRGMLAIARTAGKASYARAMRAGFDVFVHAPLDAPLEPELARAMAAQDKVSVPTLGILRSRAMRLDGDSAEHGGPGAVPGNNFDNAVQSVRTLHEAGVTICAGSTANLVPGTEAPFGESLHDELELLAAAGMPLIDVLRSATCVAATAFRLADRGIVRAGLRADLLLLEGNPLEDITTTRKIRKVWIRGEEIDRE